MAEEQEEFNLEELGEEGEEQEASLADESNAQAVSFFKTHFLLRSFRLMVRKQMSLTR